MLDFPRDSLTAVNALLEVHVWPEVEGWSRPMPSPGDRANRLLIYGYTGNAAGATALRVPILVDRARARLRQVPALAIGHTDLLKDPAALIAHYTNPMGLMACRDYCDEMILLTPRTGVVITNTARTHWEQVLSNQAEEGAEERVMKLTWRRSTRGGRTWVIPQALSASASAALQGDWSQSTGPARSTLHVQIRSDTTVDPAKALDMVKKTLRQATGEDWTTGNFDEHPDAGQVTAIGGKDGRWDGGLLVEARSPTMAATAAGALNRMCVAGVGGTQRLGIEIRHDYHGHSVKEAPSGERGQGKGNRRRR